MGAMPTLPASSLREILRSAIILSNREIIAIAKTRSFSFVCQSLQKHAVLEKGRHPVHHNSKE